MAILNEEGLAYLWSKITAALKKKVDIVEGKGLSTNDYTTAEKEKLSGLPDPPTAAQVSFPEIESTGIWYYCNDSKMQGRSEVRLWLEVSDSWKGWLTLTADDPGETVVTVYLSEEYSACLCLKIDTDNNRIGVCLSKLSGWDANQVSVKRIEYIR